MGPMGDEESHVGGAEQPTDDAQIRTFLIADVRGWTVFTQARGDEAAGKLAAKFAGIARESVEGRDGTLLELRGDEALCVFVSPRQAIRAAVDLQQRFVEETLADPELPLTVGIGLDAGAAVEVEGGYRGGALNLAARLCSRARAGEILASREVAHLARRIDGVRYEDRGSISLKGLDEPVALVRVAPESLDAVERLSPYTPVRAPEPRRRRPPWPAIVAAALAIVLIAVGLPILLSGGDPIDVRTNSIARIAADEARLELATPLGERPGASAIGLGSLWVAQPDRGTVARLSLEDGSVIDPSIRVGASPEGIAVGDGAVWVTNSGDGTVSRIDVETNEVSQELEVGSRPTAIDFGDGALWVADAFAGELLKVELASRDVESVRLAGEPSGVAFTQEGVWVSVAPSGIARVDPADLGLTFAHQSLGSGPTAVLPAFGSIWVTNQFDDTVSRVEPSTGREDAKIPVGDGPNAVTSAGGSLWVANELDGSISKIDPATNQAGPPVPVGGTLASLDANADDLWLAVGASADEHRGGTLTVSSADRAPRSLDPAFAFNDVIEGQILSITNDGLLSYRKVGGGDGATLEPDLASALPEVSPDGMTYRFPLRSGIGYSTGEPVRPEDFRHGLERSIALGPPDAGFFQAIDGANGCVEDSSTCDLSDSIEVSEEAVTIHLTRPDPDLPFKLAGPTSFPVPVSIPFKDQLRTPVPATGPYMIENAGPGGIELVRNPEFEEWSRAAQPAGFVDAISMRFNEEPESAFERLNAGELDWMRTRPGPDDLDAFMASHPDQVALWLGPATIYVGFDVRMPPFDDVLVRRALNYAIDRAHAVELAGGPTSHSLTCQILPPNVQGYEQFCPYTVAPDSGGWSAPDLERARDLVEEAGVIGERVRVWVSDAPEFGNEAPVAVMTHVVEVLNELGFRAELEIVHDGDEYQAPIYFEGPGSKRYQVYHGGWGQTYSGAGGFIDEFFRCGILGQAPILCTERLDRAIQRAQAVQGADPPAAHAAWVVIEHGLVEDAVIAPLMNPVSAYLFSDRVENVQVHPQWGILISQLWVQ